MARFIVSQTQACWVTWTHLIEAPDGDTARLVVDDPHIDYEGCSEIHDEEFSKPDIGDLIDGYDTIYNVEEAKEVFQTEIAIDDETMKGLIMLTGFHGADDVPPEAQRAIAFIEALKAKRDA